MLLLALASAKRDIHALAVSGEFFADDMRMILKPNLAFVPKVVGSWSPIDLAAFYPGFYSTLPLGEVALQKICAVASWSSPC